MQMIQERDAAANARRLCCCARRLRCVGKGGTLMNHTHVRSTAGLFALAGLAVALTTFSGSAKGQDDDGNGQGAKAYTIGMFGDMPYGTLGRSQYPALIADI